MSLGWWRMDTVDRHAGVARWYVALVGLAAGATLVPKSIDIPHRLMHGVHLMAPSCGLGRAGRAVLRLQFERAVKFNPAIFPLVLAGAALAIRYLVGRTTGRWLTICRLPGRRAVFALGTAGLALTAWQQYRFGYLIENA